MLPSGIQGQLLEVTVVGCSRLKDTEWVTRQDPYVCLEYGHQKFRTRTCRDGGKNPTFNEKHEIPLTEGLREMNVMVWNDHTISRDELIGSGRIQLQKVLSMGYDDAPWTIQGINGRYAGEVSIILHYRNAQTNPYCPSPVLPTPYAPPYPPTYPPPYPPTYPPSYPPATVPYPQPTTVPYPQPTYPPPPATGVYPPPPPPTYPPSHYVQQPYPPQPHQHYCPPGVYPPRPPY